MPLAPSSSRRDCVCGSDDLEVVFDYDAPPSGEVPYGFNVHAQYRRTMMRCRRCGHFLSDHTLDAGALYTGEYNRSTYGPGGLKPAFERIMALDPRQSDNVGRVERIVQFARKHFTGNEAARSKPSILDVGSGLCVFLCRMKAEGWDCTAIDPDPVAAEHAREIVGVNAVCGDFLETGAPGAFDAVTFNKVLEHVKHPVSMLSRARDCLKRGGFVYVEVPDGEMAAQVGSEREEFYIDHLHVFSPASLAILATRAGYLMCALERLTEPSGKFTLRAFLSST
jgi:2-polyprenyl-3-methyl-5-hydroxy-6-metoxy-1,4-benzoquinol methylase